MIFSIKNNYSLWKNATRREKKIVKWHILRLSRVVFERNQFITFIFCDFLDFLFEILSLAVKINLPLNL